MELPGTDMTPGVPTIATAVMTVEEGEMVHEIEGTPETIIEEIPDGIVGTIVIERVEIEGTTIIMTEIEVETDRGMIVEIVTEIGNEAIVTRRLYQTFPSWGL